MALKEIDVDIRMSVNATFLRMNLAASATLLSPLSTMWPQEVEMLCAHSGFDLKVFVFNVFPRESQKLNLYLKERTCRTTF